GALRRRRGPAAAGARCLGARKDKGPRMSRLERLRQAELWTTRLRIVGVALGVFEVGALSHPYPDGYETAAWLITFCFAVGSLVLLVGCRAARTRAGLRRIGFSALLFDTAIAYAYMTVFSFEPGV